MRIKNRQLLSFLFNLMEILVKKVRNRRWEEVDGREETAATINLWNLTKELYGRTRTTFMINFLGNEH
jgi:hypothetical protein